MTIPARVTLVTLGVVDVARVSAFYEGIGWRKSAASVDGEVSFFQLGPVGLAIWGRAELAADAGVEDAGAGFRGVALALNLPSESDVDEVATAWVAAGGELVKAPEPTVWGGYTGYVADPEGHLWELAHNPGFALAADGAVILP